MSNIKCQISNKRNVHWQFEIGNLKLEIPAIWQAGFTIPELIIVMSVFGALIIVTTINLLGFQRSTSTNTAITTLVTDIKQQQIKSMSGDTEGRSSPDNYGLYFQPQAYILFHGVSYNPLDQSNFRIDVGEDLEFSNILFPSSTVLFASGSGEIVNFTPGSNTVSLRNKNSQNIKTIEINRYGVITNVN